MNFANVGKRSAKICRNLCTKKRELSTTTFDGDMARLYLTFFNQAESAWNKTEEIIKDALQTNGGKPVKEILDIASGPGEPALTLARAYPEANVFLTDGAEAMLSLANDRIAAAGVDDRVTTGVMDLNDFSPVQNRPVDLVTAQFALMFTEDLPGSLNEIHGVLRDGGLLVGTVWEEFYILPLLGETMTTVMGEAPPSPPINPLSLKDAAHLDASLADAGFTTFGRHNEKAQIDINLGAFANDDTIKCCLIPVNPSLVALQEGGNHGDDVFGTAMNAMRGAISNHGMINDNGEVVIKTSTYRYFVAQK
jgi:SAM-dependent methyltransferase